jgi:SAM-dependent methyltransferase
VTPRDRPEIDFGTTADDYARHRPGFPAEAFEAFAAAGIGQAGQRVIDLGTGTGTLARGFAARGCVALGIDASPGMIAAAATGPRPGRGTLGFARAWAETLPIGDARCDVVCAGQCWHWFDRARAAAEVARVLAPGGRALIAFFSYLSEPGSLGDATEAIVLRHQPDWAWAHKDGRYPEFVPELDFALPIAFTHASWRGRFRACNGVLTLPPAEFAAFDRELAALLTASWPEPLEVEHRVWAAVARRRDEIR